MSRIFGVVLASLLAAGVAGCAGDMKDDQTMMKDDGMQKDAMMKKDDAMKKDGMMK
jgi:hypothetical protein